MWVARTMLAEPNGAAVAIHRITIGRSDIAAVIAMMRIVTVGARKAVHLAGPRRRATLAGQLDCSWGTIYVARWRLAPGRLRLRSHGTETADVEGPDAGDIGTRGTTNKVHGLNPHSHVGIRRSMNVGPAAGARRSHPRRRKV